MSMRAYHTKPRQSLGLFGRFGGCFVFTLDLELDFFSDIIFDCSPNAYFSQICVYLYDDATMAQLQHCLVMDIGNSYTELAHCPNALTQPLNDLRFTAIKRFPTPELLTHLSLLSPDYPLVVSSVVPIHDRSVKTAHPNSLFVTYRSVQKYLNCQIKHPSQIGADRLINALGALHLFKPPLLLIDSGTATTCCYIDEKGVYQGGSIMPGMGISSQALHDYTAKIPLIRVKESPLFYGKSTREAVQSGLYWSSIFGINGFITAFRNDIPGITVIGAGRGIMSLRTHLDLDAIEPLLTLKGLAIFHRLSA